MFKAAQRQEQWRKGWLFVTARRQTLFQKRLNAARQRTAERNRRFWEILHHITQLIWPQGFLTENKLPADCETNALLCICQHLAWLKIWSEVVLMPTQSQEVLPPFFTACPNSLSSMLTLWCNTSITVCVFYLTTSIYDIYLDFHKNRHRGFYFVFGQPVV